MTFAPTIADEVVLIDNSNIEPHEAFVIMSDEILSFDIGENRELRTLLSCKVCDAYDIVRTAVGFRKL